MSEHVHYWRLQVEGPDCEECQYSAIMGLAACACGELLAPLAIERRLNATERLSAVYAQLYSEHITEDPPLYLEECSTALSAYAAALDGEDDLSKLPTQQKLTAEDMEST